MDFFLDEGTRMTLIARIYADYFLIHLTTLGGFFLDEGTLMTRMTLIYADYFLIHLTTLGGFFYGFDTCSCCMMDAATNSEAPSPPNKSRSC